MKNTILRLVISILFLAGVTSANAVIINDTYQGSNGHGYGDRIGKEHYEVQNMDVTFSGGYMNVRVNTNFDEVSDKYNIQFGDLFISTNGWNPFGSAPYKNDNAANGEKWEFVFDTSENMLYGGKFTVNLSDNMVSPSLTFRNGQEVQRKAGGTALGGSNVDLSHAGMGGYVEYNIQLSSLGIIGDDIGLKWGMTCANDTIEGAIAAPVPEPGSLSLLALVLLGLGAYRFKQS